MWQKQVITKHKHDQIEIVKHGPDVIHRNFPIKNQLIKFET
jgi:hypothetical protein